MELNDMIRDVAEWDGWAESINDAPNWVRGFEKKKPTKFDYHTNIVNLYPVSGRVRTSLYQQMKLANKELRKGDAIILQAAYSDIGHKCCLFETPPTALFAATHAGIVLLNKYKK